MVSPDVVSQLRQLSAKPMHGLGEVPRDERFIARYKEQKGEKSVTLNEAKFMKERAELNADKEEEKTIEKLRDQRNRATIIISTKRWPSPPTT